MNRKKQAAFLFFIFLLPLILFSGKKVNEKDLPQKYRDWLKLTSYIIFPKEKEVFMELTTDRDRDLFIESFWKQRDPTPGTPQNEYKDEHIQRFFYANKIYKRGSPREGWMTDMGRIYIILGPPSSIERIEGAAGVHPCQVWYYHGDRKKGLPTYFALVFYQRGGSGEFKLYNPASEGPLSLLVDTEGMDITDYQQAYRKIRELAPTLAGVSISMIPGQYPYNFEPSPRNNIILADIFKSPTKDVSPSYATHFLNYKGVVSTEYLTNFVESHTNVLVSKDPILGIPILHFSINPKSVSIDYFEPKNQYFCNFELNVSLRRGENILYQYSKNFPFYFAPEDMDRIQGNGISIEDSFPVIEGTSQVNILVQNSVGKEFSVFEKEIFVPGQSEIPHITGFVLGFELEDYSPEFHVPYKVGNKKLSVDTQDTFTVSDDISFLFSVENVTKPVWEKGKVNVSLQGLGGKNPEIKSFSIELKNYFYNDVLLVSHSFPARELSPDYYEIKLELQEGNGDVLDEEKENFILSPQEVVPRPVTLAKSFPLSNRFLYYYSMAYQYDQVDDQKKAETYFQKAYEINRGYLKGIVDYANFLLKVQKYEKTLELAEKIKDESSLQFDSYLIKGRAHMALGQFSKAIENLLEGNKIYNSSTTLLNSLGFCYHKTGEKTKALEVLRASLRLNPDQKDIKDLVQQIEREED